MASTPIARIPRGFQHLVSTRTSKFAGRTPSRFPHPTTTFVQPHDRIRKWNIRPGDKVRLIAGKPKEKFRNDVSSAEGYKVYTVKQVDMTRNRVYLEGIHNMKSQTIQKRPENYDELDEDHKRSYNEQKNYVPTLRPVHYSNVQLCLEDRKSSESVFVSRIKTGATHFNINTQRLDWKRYATKISGPLEAELERSEIRIDWPRPDKEWIYPGPEVRVDTRNSEAAKQTLHIPSLNILASNESISHLFPQHINAPAPSDQTISDWYVKGLKAEETRKTDENISIEALMPLYLSEELSPRFASIKMYKGWRARQEAEAAEKKRIGQDAVMKWEANGRDNGLKEVLDLEVVGLEGVHLRLRTAQEVRQAAMEQYDTVNAQVRAAVAQNVREGMRYDHELDEWIPGPKALNLDRKRRRKERKIRRMEEKMVNLKLKETTGMVVPPEVRFA
ncbi:uncharacterized protein L203_105323 [Cryptococcus depauperatus CBS 7841]|uniref:Uncharacterized protein n=1 Tax=Cryptococcus depauperatus CBS 7841 TaxID=1295531 RepID=A0A1E3HP69_9TREE|nr:hypothetical protein L203_06320 [Cryptococcus depauperatus CBS 7841]